MAAKILVTGDVVLDHNIYEGKRLAPDAPPGAGAYYKPMAGGAMLVHDLLNALEPACVRFGLEQTTPEQLWDWPKQFHAKALWHTVDNVKKETGRHWALDRYLGYGEPKTGDYPGKLAGDLGEGIPRVLVLDDGGLGFREAKQSWPAFLSGDRPEGLEWVILKMSRPLAQGKLWTSLVRESWRKRLIVVVSADQLRSEGLLVAGGLSWETSVDDIVEELESNQTLRGLKQCQHLIVTMRSDAALWLDRAGKPKDERGQLVFDRKLCEGEWQDKHEECRAYGSLSCTTASVAWAVSEAICAKEGPEGKDKPPVDELDLTTALVAGLSTTRFLLETGHGKAGAEPDFPFGDAARHLKAESAKDDQFTESAYSRADVRCGSRSKQPDGLNLEPGKWTILGLVSPWHIKHDKVSLEPARRVALFGPDKLPGVPCATFGDLRTLDRREIDSLRAIRRLMLMYRDAKVRNQPLCLGVFGAPGSGKSFGLKQIAKGVFGEKAPLLEFNLSQFNGPADLIGAFHQVRDKVLSGPTPVVFWDEFDSDGFQWLKRFLAPMQDGAFQEGQVTHSLGKSVFIFAGGTNFSFEQFQSHKDDPDFIAQKGTDIISRLSGYLDIAGPNQREAATQTPIDREYPVRRAMVIRIALELGDIPLEIERGLLTALLKVGRYRNGARSLTKLVSYIRDRGGFPLRRAYLPPDDILALHVENVEEFHEITRKYAEFYAQTESRAREIHEEYLISLSKKTEEERRSRPNNVGWDKLTPSARESNYAAALRIPEILEYEGFALADIRDPRPGIEKIPGDEVPQEVLDRMAEAEHGGWEEERRMNGWTFSKHRSDKALRHYLLIPFGSLTPEDKAFDIDAIKKYPSHAKEAGYKIERVK
jgi:hypothetical protein